MTTRVIKRENLRVIINRASDGITAFCILAVVVASALLAVLLADHHTFDSDYSEAANRFAAIGVWVGITCLGGSIVRLWYRKRYHVQGYWIPLSLCAVKFESGVPVRSDNLQEWSLLGPCEKTVFDGQYPESAWVLYDCTEETLEVAMMWSWASKPQSRSGRSLVSTLVLTVEVKVFGSHSALLAYLQNSGQDDQFNETRTSRENICAAIEGVVLYVVNQFPTKFQFAPQPAKNAEMSRTLYSLLAGARLSCGFDITRATVSSPTTYRVIYNAA